MSIQVLNLDGRHNLDACLSSLEAQVFPRDRFEIVLVDNETSRGRGAVLNAAVRRCGSEFVAVLNGDARVEPAWLAELVSAAERHQAVAVASTILDWAGETIDSAGELMSFVGHTRPIGAGEPAAQACVERPILFASAGAALYSRAAFLEAGGFDEDFVECLEDADLGWRLNLSGGRTVLAPKAVACRRQRGTTSRWSRLQQLRLVERNALAMIYKNYEEVSLERVLPVAVALSLLRGLQSSGIDTLQLRFSLIPPDSVDVDRRLIAHLIGLEDFARDLPTLQRKRAEVQARRRRSDVEMLELFDEPSRLYGSRPPGLFDEVARVLIDDFGIEEMFRTRQPARRSLASEQGTRGAPPATASARIPPELPKVSIVILTALGATHLRECLDSLRRQTYPGDRIEVIVVDNGSTDDPTREVLARVPHATVIRNEANIGFAAGNNQGAAAATGDYVVFLNDDTRAHPDWLHELVGTARRRRTAAVSSYILDWSGANVDFVEGAVNFEAKGFQLKHGMRARRVTPEERPLLFACGCAMLVDRAVLEDAGGWDEGTFAYYEDVELGWRLHMLGHQVWLAPRAIVYHKHHGTSGQWPDPPRIRLGERNSLRALYCLLEAASLERVFPAALLLAADRALLDTGLSRAADRPPSSAYRRLIASTKLALRVRGVTKSMTPSEALAKVWSQGLLGLARDVWRPGAAPESRAAREVYLVDPGNPSRTRGPSDGTQSPDDRLQSIPIGAAAVLAGVHGFLSDLPELSRRRAALQGRRQVTDRDILKRFGTHWLRPCPVRLQSEHTAMQSCLAGAFALNAFDLPAAPK